MATITIIQGHPDPSGGHFCHALARAYCEGAAAGGHEVSFIDVAHLDFPLLRTREDFETGKPPAELGHAAGQIAACDHVVIVFPLWLGTMPALLKGFLEQVARPGVAFEYVKDGMPRKLWAGKSARIVVTMGMPALVYRWWFGAHGLRGLERNILNFVGVKPVRESLFGLIENVSDAKRRKWMEKMRAYGKDAK